MDQRADNTAQVPPTGQTRNYARPSPGSTYSAAQSGSYGAGGQRGYSRSSYTTEAYSSVGPPRQARLSVTYVDPWSVLKFSFVVSLVCFVALFVAVALLYAVLSGMGVFSAVQGALGNVTSSQGSGGVNASPWLSASTVFGYTALFGILEVVVIMVLSTVIAGIYNLVTRLIGGVEVTLSETG